jgi:preprotein translocase subunit SecA
MVDKVKEFIHLLKDLSPADLADMTVSEMKVFFHEEVRKAYDLKEHQVDKIRAGLMREVEYKQEGYEMFLEMMIDIRRNVVYSLFQFQPQPQPQTV